jgi:hypothetical protein
MTRTEFLRRLRRTRTRWALDEDGCIRDTHKRCPIEVVLRTGANIYIMRIAAERKLRSAEAIMCAADNGFFGSVPDPRLRQQLLAATVDRRRRKTKRKQAS